MNKPQIPDYDIQELIGEGGMGLVWKARHTKIERNVAIKVMHSNYAHNTDFRNRFGQEARSTGNLEHPNIIRLYEFNDFNQTLYLVMELANSGDLKRYMEQHKQTTGQPLEIEEVVDIAKPIADALYYAFSSLDIVHRDVKPANVLLHRNHTGALVPKLTDFGLVRLASGSDTIYGTPIGTLAYMSPEQCEGVVEVTHESDIYSFGVMLYEMVTGQVPFQPRNFAEARRMHMEESYPAPTILRPQTPPRLEQIIEKCLKKRPHERYRTAFDIVRDLDKVQKGERAVEVAPPQPSSSIHLKIVFEGKEQRPTTELMDGDSFVLGRPSIDGSVKADIVLDTKRPDDRRRVSRHHARIERHGDQVYITDLKSGNGTYIQTTNGEKRLPPNQQIAWEMGTTMRIETFDLVLQPDALAPQPQPQYRPPSQARRAAPPPPHSDSRPPAQAQRPSPQPPSRARGSGSRPPSQPRRPERGQSSPPSRLPQGYMIEPDDEHDTLYDKERNRTPEADLGRSQVAGFGGNGDNPHYARRELDLDVDLEDVGRVFEVRPGRSVVIRVLINNKSKNNHHLTPYTTGDVLPEWVAFHPDKLELMPNEDERPVDITVTPPAHHTSKTGQKNLQIAFKSRIGKDTVPVSATVDVLPYRELLVKMLPEEPLTNNGNATLVIENRGNTQSSYRLGYIDSQRKVKVSFEEQQLTIEAGGLREVGMTITTEDRRPILGVNDNAAYSVTVQDLAPDAPNDTIATRLNIRPWIHRDWLRNIGIALAMLATVWGFLYMFLIRPANDERVARQTEVAQNQAALAATQTAEALRLLQLTQTAEALALTQTQAYWLTQTALAPTPEPGDTDGDGLTDDEERELGTEINNVDTDGDGLTDRDEVRRYNTDPLKQDTDEDGLIDGDEVNVFFTLPTLPDTDGDGVNDRQDPAPVATPTPSPLPSNTPFVASPTVTATPAGGVCGLLEPRLEVGMIGRVEPGGQPQRIREEPGLSGEWLNSAPPETLFRVVGGPACVDNITWWEIQADGYPQGWMAEGVGAPPDGYHTEPCPGGECPAEGG
jgi:serine/threonine protein kinase